MVSGALPNPHPKNTHKRHPQESQKYRDSTIMRSPRNKERTRTEQTFGDFFASGRPWATLGGQDGPETSPKSLRGPHFLMICDRCLMLFLMMWSPAFLEKRTPAPQRKQLHRKAIQTKTCHMVFHVSSSVNRIGGTSRKAFK